MKFIETIKFDGNLHNLSTHQNRVNQTFQKFFIQTIPHNLSKIINSYLSKNNLDENLIWKIRIIYTQYNYQIEASQYLIKKIHQLKLVDIGNFDYSYKFADRSYLEKLILENPEADDLILTKNGLITDSTYANLAFLKEKRFYTPNSFLLNGTKRQSLIEKKLLAPQTISIDNLKEYESVFLINAMIDLKQISISINDITR